MDGHDAEEGPAPVPDLGEDVAERWPDHGSDTPDGGVERHCSRPQPLGEDNAEHRSRLGDEEAGAEALHEAAGQHHDHRRREAADQAADGEGGRGDHVAAARTDGFGTYGSEQRRNDRGDDEHRGVPRKELEAADVGDDRGHHGGDDEGFERLEAGAPRDDREGQAAGLEQFAPRRLRGGHVCFLSDWWYAYNLKLS